MPSVQRARTRNTYWCARLPSIFAGRSAYASAVDSKIKRTPTHTHRGKHTNTQAHLRVALRHERRAQLVAEDLRQRISHACPALGPHGVHSQLHANRQVALLAPLQALQSRRENKTSGGSRVPESTCVDTEKIACFEIATQNSEDETSSTNNERTLL